METVTVSKDTLKYLAWWLLNSPNYKNQSLERLCVEEVAINLITLCGYNKGYEMFDEAERISRMNRYGHTLFKPGVPMIHGHEVCCPDRPDDLTKPTMLEVC